VSLLIGSGTTTQQYPFVRDPVFQMPSAFDTGIVKKAQPVAPSKEKSAVSPDFLRDLCV
jgi:hypothetical protein